jgi:hypothetical protein
MWHCFGKNDRNKKYVHDQNKHNFFFSQIFLIQGWWNPGMQNPQTGWANYMSPKEAQAAEISTSLLICFCGTGV